MKKGQMFIVTVVFLTGLIFTVQQLLFQYTAIDPAEPMQKTDWYLLKSIQNTFNDTIKGSVNCTEAETRLQELGAFLERQTFRGFIVDLKYDLNCTRWGTKEPVLVLDTHIQGRGIDTRATYHFYK